jgi:hypothetical protein
MTPDAGGGDRVTEAILLPAIVRRNIIYHYWLIDLPAHFFIEVTRI